MRILFNCMTLRKGGAERVINILANSFATNNEVMVVANVKNKIEYDFKKNIKIEALAKNDDNKFLRKLQRISPFMMYKLKKYIISFQPDVIISFLPEPNFRLLFLKKYSKNIKNIPVIISVRNDPNTEYKSPIYHFLMKKLYPCANQMVLQTKDAKQYFINHINYNGVVIPNPVSDIFLVQPYKGIREKRFVAVGRLYQQKNYYNMIDAFGLFHKKHQDYILDIYGDGVLKEKIQKYINSKGLAHFISLKGKSDDIKSEIYNASAFILSSDYEGMPNSLLEAACLGIPCISTDCPCGGPRDILENGKNGILVPIKDSICLANAMNEIVEDKKMAKKLSCNSSSNSVKYKVECIVDNWKTEIQKILNQK